MASNALFSGQLIISNQKGEVLDEGATQKLVCFKCNQILSDPRQTECGERICKACISRCVYTIMFCVDKVYRSVQSITIR